MTYRHLPSVEALVADDDDRVIAELRLLEAREHVAHAKELLDRAERLVPPRAHDADGVGAPSPDPAEHVVEELARLGCKMVEIASALSRVRAA